jgi:CheY-like chemotaxis protein
MSLMLDASDDTRPEFRIAMFGLAQKFQRLLEIVVRHARHNQYRYVLAGSRGPGEYDIALVDMTARGGNEVASTLRRMSQSRPIVTVGRRNDSIRGRDDLLQNTFTMNVLKTLNAAVEQQRLRRIPLSVAPLGASARPRLPDPAGVPPLAVVPMDDETRRARALVVDDSPTVRRQLSLALTQMGIDCEAVGSAEEALDTLATRRYELIFVDIVMPEMDGYRLTREIKRDRALRATPVVILTTRSSPFDLARGALAGCSSYLVKPVTLQSLRATVARHLRKSLPRDSAIKALDLA